MSTGVDAPAKDMTKMKTVVETINRYSSDDELRPIVERLKNKILYCKNREGKPFVSKLIAIKGDLLFFETKNGQIIINNINEIASCSEYRTRPEVI